MVNHSKCVSVLAPLLALLKNRLPAIVACLKNWTGFTVHAVVFDSQPRQSNRAKQVLMQQDATGELRFWENEWTTPKVKKPCQRRFFHVSLPQQVELVCSERGIATQPVKEHLTDVSGTGKAL